MPGPENMVLIDPEGNPREMSVEQAAAALDSPGWRVQTDEDRRGRLAGEAREETYGGVKGAVGATGAALLRGGTLGFSDVAISALGGREDLNALREVHPELSAGAEIVGGVASSLLVPGGAIGAGARAGAAPAGALRSIGRAVASGAREGAIQGAGAGVSELALSSDPLSVERIASSIGSNALFGAAVGGVAGGVAKGVDHALVKARGALDDVVARGRVMGDVPEDLAGLDAKALRKAREAELVAIETGRVPQRAQLSEEITAFRREMKEQKVWLATKGAEEAELRAIGKRTLKADKALDNLIDDPKYFAENPKGALSHLRKQEAALDELVTKHGDNLRAKFAADTTGDRLAALDNAAKALERNRALQQKIADLATPPGSPRLTAIDDAKEALVTGASSKKGLVEQIAGNAVFGNVAGAIAALPIPGASFIAPLLGARAANAVGEKLFGRLGSAVTASAERASKGVGMFLDASRKVTPAAPVLATKVLQAASFSDEKKRKAKDSDKPQKLPDLYKRVSEEVRSQTAYGPDGPVMRPEARQKLGAKLAPIRATDPILADKIETAAAARVAYIASKLPRRPDIAGMQLGPDRWQPSDMAMRSFARTIEAVNDPNGIIERMASGAITPEDAEVMRDLYPAQLADITQQILEQLPTLQKQLPYHRRLALSIMTGLAVDPAMDPRVLNVLQATFKREEGSDGGMRAPMPAPQFGSVSKEQPTAGQQRST